MRSVWSGVIAFGMVNIPVKLYTSVGKTPVKLSRISRCCKSQVGYKNYCKECGRSVESEGWDMGFQVSKGEFVLITHEQIEAIKIPSEEIIELFSFITKETINPVWRTGDSYYIGIAAGSGKLNRMALKTYVLLKRVMEAKGVVGIGKLCQRGVNL